MQNKEDVKQEIDVEHVRHTPSSPDQIHLDTEDYYLANSVYSPSIEQNGGEYENIEICEAMENEEYGINDFDDEQGQG